MHIRDFYSKFASANEEGQLFRALRRLSLIEDVKNLSATDGDIINLDWAPWPPMESNAASLAT